MDHSCNWLITQKEQRKSIKYCLLCLDFMELLQSNKEQNNNNLLFILTHAWKILGKVIFTNKPKNFRNFSNKK